MTLFPVVERELRVASRRRWTYWGRAASGLLAVLVTGWLLLVQTAAQMRPDGRMLFYSVAGLAMFFVAFSGVTYSADSVSSEKRDGTLGLLFLTDLKGYDVALGKLAATSLGAFYGLLALLPVLAMGILLGGVTGGEYSRMVLVLLSTLLLSLSAGLAFSVFCRDAFRASLGTFVFMASVFALMPALAALVDDLLEWQGHPGSAFGKALWRWIGWMSPVSAYSRVEDSVFRREPGRFWRAEGWMGFLTLGLLVLSCLRLPHSWQEKGAQSRTGGWAGWMDRVRFPNPASRRSFRTAWLELNPIAWLSGRFWMRSMSTWCVLAVAALGFIYGGWRVGSSWWNSGVYLTLSIILHLIFKVWIANEVPRQFVEDRRSGALELILTTPLDVGEIIAGRRLALIRQFGAPIAVLLVVDAIFLTTGVRSDVSGGNEQAAWILFWIFRMVSLPADAFTLFWLGLWRGMAGNGTRTSSGILWRALVLPQVVWGILLTLIGVASVGSQSNTLTPLSILAAWVLICAGNSTLWIVRAHHQLTSGFRAMAQQGTAPYRGGFFRWRKGSRRPVAVA